MVFNSIEFLLFCGLFFLLWPIFRTRNNSRWLLIVVSSFIFYGWWDWRFLFLIIFSGLIDYITGWFLPKKQRYKKFILQCSLAANLGSLAVFKYSVFFATVLTDALSFGGVELNLIEKIPEFALILPVGISFYTFQSLSYTLDIYHGRLKPVRNILHFFAYLAMFPQLVAGPIVRAKDFLKQLSSYRIPNSIEVWNATKLIVFGLFQKMVIADNLSLFIDSAYGGISLFDGTLYWWVVAVAFSIQIYADFSGYSLIARGIAKLMGYHFKMNFNHPYISATIKEFWSRWHISLSTWFRDYVYIPLGGSRQGALMGMVALCSTMLLSGIWHGANYTFIIWASLHSVFLIAERYVGISKISKKYPLLFTTIVFIQVTVAWVYFRAESVQQANTVVGNLFTLKSTDLAFINYYFNNLIFLFIAFVIESFIYFKKKRKTVLIRLFINQSTLDSLKMACCILLILFFRGEGKQFIYFQF